MKKINLVNWRSIASVIVVVCFLSLQIIASTHLVTKISARRGPKGGIFITGITTLPIGTKLGIDLLKGQKIIGQARCSVVSGGNFEAGQFTDGDKFWPTGNYKVCIYSHFTKLWDQPKQVLDQVGENGINLPHDMLVPDDPEFPNAGRHLEIYVFVSFPPIPPDIYAIQSVQQSKLFVTGKGQCTSTVKEVVAWYDKVPGISALSWSAEEDDKGNFVVSLECLNGSKQEKAQWSFNPKTREVKYLNPFAKTLSWLSDE